MNLPSRTSHHRSKPEKMHGHGLRRVSPPWRRAEKRSANVKRRQQPVEPEVDQ